jgi:hypothetical protein
VSSSFTIGWRISGGQFSASHVRVSARNVSRSAIYIVLERDRTRYAKLRIAIIFAGDCNGGRAEFNIRRWHVAAGEL